LDIVIKFIIMVFGLNFGVVKCFDFLAFLGIVISIIDV